jgi:chemotaxis methyl-accepting protein methylase
MTAIADIADLVRRETGIVLPPTREAAVIAAVRRAAPGLDPAAFVRAASGPDGDQGLLNRLIDEVAIQETSFVRDRIQFDEIDWHRLLRGDLAAGSGIIRVWSAGCASGEEAYTLALLAAEAFAPAPPPVDVLGTDVSGAALAAATAGRYGERAIRGIEPTLRERYFDRQADGSYLVGHRLRALVRFRRHNLVRDLAPPPGESHFDLVVCRNVLIYFEAPTIARVIGLLERSLRRGGVLMLGAADALHRFAAEPEPNAGRGGRRAGRGNASWPDSRRQPASSGWRTRSTRPATVTATERWHRCGRCSARMHWMPTPISSMGSSRWRPASLSRRWRRFAGPCSPTPASRSRPLPSAVPTTYWVTRWPRAVPTSLPCEPWTQRMTGTGSCFSRSTSAT